ncbi:MAG: hypothetical protein M1831_005869 [Alyxoria varia]|nr:MAG: hypothetical protein M1831_005869 [Alyxoria varia]
MEQSKYAPSKRKEVLQANDTSQDPRGLAPAPRQDDASPKAGFGQPEPDEASKENVPVASSHSRKKSRMVQSNDINQDLKNLTSSLQQDDSPPKAGSARSGRLEPDEASKEKVPVVPSHSRKKSRMVQSNDITQDLKSLTSPLQQDDSPPKASSGRPDPDEEPKEKVPVAPSHSRKKSRMVQSNDITQDLKSLTSPLQQDDSPTKTRLGRPHPEEASKENVHVVPSHSRKKSRMALGSSESRDLLVSTVMKNEEAANDIQVSDKSRDWSESPLTPFDPLKASQSFRTSATKASMPAAASTATGQPQDAISTPSSATKTPDVSSTAATPEIQRSLIPSLTQSVGFKKILSKKGKPCIVRIPKENPDPDFARMPLTKEEYTSRLDAFEEAGYDIRGFDHGQPEEAVPVSQNHSQNKAIFPDPNEKQPEERPARALVAIPDLEKWNNYVYEVRESVLKALGVSTGSEDDTGADSASRSNPTPFAPNRMAMSPPVPSSSVGSQHPWANVMPGSAPLTPGENSLMAGVASPGSSLGRQARPGHLSRQSTFGFPFPSASASQRGHSMSPNQFTNMHGNPRGGSPALPGNLQRLPSSLSRASPDIFMDRKSTPYNQEVSKPPRRGNLVSEAQPIEWSEPSRSPKSRMPAVTQASSNANGASDAYGELAFPTPQGHHRNISQNLEREAENAQYYPGEYVDGTPDGPKTNAKQPEDSWKVDRANDSQSSAGQQMSHKSRPSNVSNASSSRFNAGAKEFQFNSNKVHSRQSSVGKNPFLPNIGASTTGGSSGQTAVSLITAHANGEPTGENSFNAAAPIFKPPHQAGFAFASSGFNFLLNKPGKEKGGREDTKSDKEAEPKSDAGNNRIFSVPDIVKPAKKSKAIPIVDPNVAPEKPAEEDLEDESGHITQAQDRIKRGRRDAPDDDDVPKFSVPGENAEADNLNRFMKESSPQPESAASIPKDTKTEKDDALAQEPWHDLSDIEPPKRFDDAPAGQMPLIDTGSSSQNNIEPISGASASVDPSEKPLGEIPSAPHILDTKVENDQMVPSPSVREIDEVMKELNKSDPELGVESAKDLEEYIDRPSSGVGESKDQVKPSDEASHHSKSPPWLQEQSTERASQSPVRKLNNLTHAQVSDWDDVLSAGEENKFLPQAQFFDTRVKSLIEGVILQQLGPLTKIVKDVDASVKTMSSIEKTSTLPAQAQAQPKPWMEKSSSDADDEDDVDSPHQPRPRVSKAEKRFEQMRTVVVDALASSGTNSADRLEQMRSVVLDALASSGVNSTDRIEQMRTVVLEALQSSGADSTDRLEFEIGRRHEAEKHASDIQRMLDLSEKEIALFKESAANHEDEIQKLRDARESSLERVTALERIERELRTKTSGLSAENSALQDTLQEYRTSSARWREEIESVKSTRESLQATSEQLRREAAEQIQMREAVDDRLAKVQDDLENATHNLANERKVWHRKDEEQAKETAILSTRLEEELRHRQKLEDEIHRMSVHEKNAIRANVTIDEVRNANNRLTADVARLREENVNQQNDAALHEREAMEAKDIARAEIQRTKTLLEAEIDIANRKAESMQTDLETRLEITRGELERSRNSAIGAQDDFKKILDQANASRSAAIKEASDSLNMRLNEERQRFEGLMNDLSKQHEVALQTAREDKKQTEMHLNETLKLSKDKIGYQQEKIKYLEDKLAVTESAAQAAAEAAQSVKAAKPVPSGQLPKPSERISTQALRESIAVLQEQLQEREGQIERLEQDLSRIDHDAPQKLKERETENGWLRELLGVRIDDLSELVNTISNESFDRTAVRDAAIRLRANLQMELQVKERQMSGDSGPRSGPASGQIPSFSDIQNFASPKAAQLAAAFSSWRKGQGSPMPSLREAVQTSAATRFGESPSKGHSSAPSATSTLSFANNSQKWHSGLMTPPASNLRRTPTPEPDHQEYYNNNSMHDDDAVPLSLQLPNEYDDLEDDVHGGENFENSPSRSRSRTPQPSYGNGKAMPPTPPFLRNASKLGDIDSSSQAVSGYPDEHRVRPPSSSYSSKPRPSDQLFGEVVEGSQEEK